MRCQSRTVATQQTAESRAAGWVVNKAASGVGIQVATQQPAGSQAARWVVSKLAATWPWYSGS
jgi:hypothetical protein